MRSGDCDLAFIRRFLPHKDNQEEADCFSTIKFTTDYMVVVLPHNHPLAGEDAVNLSELRGEEFLFLPPDSVLYSLCFKACQQAGFTPAVTYTGKRTENIVDLVSKGMGISLLMAKPVAYINTQNFVSLVPILPHLETELVIYYKKGSALSKAARHFLDFVQQ
ncbi:LysR family transcriptional regulator substrate-binding protein [Streptococcus sp. H49]|uniref:LysR family transcriptional regulator substrate-binding protein n=1 Tax=Streptococcus huangxiaojuni TaxID=3237239 RepID=UPI0034A359A1